MPHPRPAPDDHPPTRVRIEAAFKVVLPDQPEQPYFGTTAREALAAAKHDLGTKLLVTPARLVEATGWAAPTYPDDEGLLQKVLEMTGGILID